MSLLLVISTVWVTVLALTIALLRMAALADADADAERQSRQEQRRPACGPLHEHAPARARMARRGERSMAGR
jgi:hypothetical protein